MSRPDGRKNNEMRKIKLSPGVQKDPAGSVQVHFGSTIVLCAATVAEDVPPWLAAGKEGRGWITGEYAMLPGSTPDRVSRKKRGRATEIERLIGRALRAGVDLDLLGPRTITVDCDVLQADGGTRTAAITGGHVAVELAIRSLLSREKITRSPLERKICAVSCAMVNGEVVLDPDYSEDVSADVDMNFVLCEGEGLIEVQGTAEGQPFDRDSLDEMMDLACHGARQLFEMQSQVLQ